MSGVPVPPNLTMEDVEFLSRYNGQLVMPDSLQQIVTLYNESKLKLSKLQQSSEMESKVKQMCYDMLISVLDEHNQSKRFNSSLRSRSAKMRKKKMEECSKLSSIVVNESIDHKDDTIKYMFENHARINSTIAQDIPQPNFFNG